MKKIIIICFFNCLFYNLLLINIYGQSVKINSLSYNVVYNGIKNKLIIDQSKNDIRIDSIITNNGEIIKEKNIYFLIPKRKGEANIKILYRDKKKSYISNQLLLVSALPSPKVNVIGYDMEFFPSTIKHVLGIYAVIDTPVEEPICLKYKLSKYDFTYYHSDTIFISKKQTGVLDQECRNALLNYAVRGDKIRFENIKLIGVLGEEINFDYILEITEK